MNYCPNCGTQRIESAAYCHRCGRALSNPVSQPSQENQGMPVTAETPATTDMPATPDVIWGAEEAPSTAAGQVPWRGGQVVLGIILVLVSLIPVTGIAFAVGALAGRYDDATIVWVSVHLMAISIAMVVWRLGVHKRPAPWRLLGLNPMRYPLAKSVLLALGALGGSLLLTVIYSAVVNLFNLDTFSPPDIGGEIAFPGAAAFFTFQAVALVTPITEEVFFRGFVFSGLIPRFGVAKAMVLSALVFSAFHLSLGVLVPVFLTGLLLALLYRKTGSIWPCVLAHAGQNALAVALEIYA